MTSEFHASYYGDCYDPADKVSLKRKSCIVNSGRNNTRVSDVAHCNMKNLFPVSSADYRSVYQRCVAAIEENREREVISGSKGYVLLHCVMGGMNRK